MRYCPKCKTEYLDWVIECVECKVPLVSELPTVINPQQEKKEEKHSWLSDAFQPITTKEQAIRIAKEIMYFCFLVAGIQVVFMVLIQSLSYVADTILLAAMGVLIYKRMSRFVAVSLFVYFLIAAFGKFLLLAGQGKFGVGIIAAVLPLLAGLQAMKATFKYHKILQTQINVKNVIILSLIGVAYCVIFYVGLIVSLLILPISESITELVASLWIYVAMVLILLTYLHVLPFTQRWSIVRSK